MSSIDATGELQSLISPSDRARAYDASCRTGMRLGLALTRLGYISEREIAETFARSEGLRNAELTRLRPREDMDDFNARFLANHFILPLISDGNAASAVVADPTDMQGIDGIAFATESDVELLVATYSEVEEALASLAISATAPVLATSMQTSTDEDIERLLEGESDAPVIRLVQRLLAAAVGRRASDVHIEPMARQIAVRFRIDGELIEVERLDDMLAEPIATRIKVMAGLDIAESRLPQDGRLRVNVRGRDVDVRVATSPTAWGESIVLRLLGRNEVPLDLERLGLPAAALAKFVRALERPHGIILLTGPTGSGKTTTLYSAISRLRRPEVKILTVEDPVEILLNGINQVQVRPEIDLSYAATLRAFLRQDPDILMIGEIRDGETAEIAMRAALTGHLVLSTLHTNSALGAFTRLADIGVEPYLTASTVIATIAQRLVRLLCPQCRQGKSASDEERHHFRAHGIEAPILIYEAQGCSACSQSGYAGRTPLVEVIEVDDRLRTVIRTGETGELKPILPPDETLAGHGLHLVAEGRTSFAELLRATTLT